MTPQPLDYERASDSSDRPMTAARWAMLLALVACAMDGVALGAAMSDGGMGWTSAFPCLCANGFLALAFACVSIVFAISSITRRKGRDVLPWLALLLAAGAACVGILIAKWSSDAVASV